MADLEKMLDTEELAHQERRNKAREKVEIFCQSLLDFCKKYRDEAFKLESHATVVNRAIALIKAEQAVGKLNLRWKDDAKQPVVKLGEVKNGVLIVTTVEREPRKESLPTWPKLQVELAGTGQGSNDIASLARAGGLARARTMTREEQLRLSQAGTDAKKSSRAV